MKKINKVFSLLTAFALCFGSFSPISTYAEGYTAGGEGNPGFVYSEMTPTSVKQECQDRDAHTVTGGTVWWPSRSRSPEALTEDMFESCYTYMQKGTGEETVRWDNNFIMFDFDAKALMGKDYTLKYGDVVYLSFYYRSAESFSFNGETVAGEDNDTLAVKLGGHKNSGVSMTNLKKTTPDKNISSVALQTEADGLWHKAEVAFMVNDSLSDARKTGIMVPNVIRFTFDFIYLEKAFKIEMANFAVGIWNFDEAETDKSHIRALEYLCRTLEKTTAEVAAFSSDGFITETSSDEVSGEYTVTANSDNPTISLIDKYGGDFFKSLNIIRETDDEGKINLKLFAPAYDKALEENEKTQYITFEDLSWEKSPGYDGEKCTLRSISSANEKYKASYTLSLYIRPVNAQLLINGAQTNDLSGCTDGQTVTINQIYNNYENKPRTFFTLLMFYRDGILEKIVPYKTVLSPFELDKKPSFEYLLDLGDYEGITCEMIVIDTELHADVLQ